MTGRNFAEQNRRFSVYIAVFDNRNFFEATHARDFSTFPVKKHARVKTIHGCLKGAVKVNSIRRFAPILYWSNRCSARAKKLLR
jgi:hypothetical protein